jgi:catechol 2,3-dioxygenase-like lactoylglutathione lyase family enzyme
MRICADHADEKSDSIKTLAAAYRSVARMTPALDVVGLVVADLPASLAFYRRLGLDIPPEADVAPHVEVHLPGGMRLLWDPVTTIQSFDPSWTEPSGSGRVGLAFRCQDPAEVDRTYDDLVNAGHQGHHKPWDAFWGQRYATVLDPDGNAVDLYAPLAGEQVDEA